MRVVLNFSPDFFSFPEKIIVNNKIRRPDHKILAVVMVKKNPLICEESQDSHTRQLKYQKFRMLVVQTDF